MSGWAPPETFMENQRTSPCSKWKNGDPLWTIAKQFTFCGSHTLENLRKGHKCAELHGHNYTVEVVLQSGQLDSAGMVLDYGDLGEFGNYLDTCFDHRHLNDQMATTPTAENLAAHFYGFCKKHWPQTLAVIVRETPNTWGMFFQRVG